MIQNADDYDDYNQQSLMPLKRNRFKRENSESDLMGNHPGYDGGHDPNGSYQPNFNQKYQPGMYNPEDSGMGGRDINQNNAFEQTYEDLLPKLRQDIDGLIFVDNYMFPNGSMYKG